MKRNWSISRINPQLLQMTRKKTIKTGMDKNRSMMRVIREGRRIMISKVKKESRAKTRMVIWNRRQKRKTILIKMMRGVRSSCNRSMKMKLSMLQMRSNQR